MKNIYLLTAYNQDSFQGIFRASDKPIEHKEGCSYMSYDKNLTFKVVKCSMRDWIVLVEVRRNFLMPIFSWIVTSEKNARAYLSNALDEESPGLKTVLNSRIGRKTTGAFDYSLDNGEIIFNEHLLVCNRVGQHSIYDTKKVIIFPAKEYIKPTDLYDEFW